MAYIWKVATIGGTNLFSTSMIMGGSYCGMVDGETPIIGQPESLKGLAGGRSSKLREMLVQVPTVPVKLCAPHRVWQIIIARSGVW